MKTSNQLDIVSIGEPMVEFNQLPDDPIRYTQAFGGDTLNCVVAAARLGAKVAYLTCLGDDVFGQSLLGCLRKEQVMSEGVKVKTGASTGVYFITHSEEGHSFSYKRSGSAASAFCREDLFWPALENTKFFHTSGISLSLNPEMLDVLLDAAKTVQSVGGAAVFDVNIRPSMWDRRNVTREISEVVASMDIVLASEEDSQYLIDSDSYEQFFDWVLGLGARAVVFKRGKQGSIYRDTGRTVVQCPFPVDAVDATGAGDCFAGALMTELGNGAAIEEALNFASMASALACTGFGAIGPLPRRNMVLRELEKIDNAREIK